MYEQYSRIWGVCVCVCVCVCVWVNICSGSLDNLQDTLAFTFFMFYFLS
jgi:hypothetical protein